MRKARTRGRTTNKHLWNVDGHARVLDPTLEEIAARRAEIDATCGMRRGPNRPFDAQLRPTDAKAEATRRILSWLFDADNVAPLAVAVPEGE